MFNLQTYTIVHVLISLIGIATGVIVALGLLDSNRLTRPTRVFLASTALTSLTGFGFPFGRILPSHIVGLLSLGMLIVAVFARYGRGLAGAWRWIYVVTAMIALYFNVFVLVAQLFQKVPMLKSVAPTQSEPPFAVTQLAVLAIFFVFTIVAAMKFHPERKRSTTAAI